METKEVFLGSTLMGRVRQECWKLSKTSGIKQPKHCKQKDKIGSSLNGEDEQKCGLQVPAEKLRLLPDVHPTGRGHGLAFRVGEGRTLRRLWIPRGMVNGLPNQSQLWEKILYVSC